MSKDTRFHPNRSALELFEKRRHSPDTSPIVRNLDIIPSIHGRTYPSRTMFQLGDLLDLANKYP